MGEKGNNTRKLIREQAYHLFAAKGFAGVTMKDICEACGLSRGGLYRHYGSTRQIFEEILGVMSAKDDDFIRNGIKEGFSPTEMLTVILSGLRTEMLDSTNSLCYAIYEYSRLCSSEFMEVLNVKAKDKWRLLLEYGKKCGEFHHKNTDQMIDTILYVYQGIQMWNQIISMDEKTIDNIVNKIESDLKGGN